MLSYLLETKKEKWLHYSAVTISYPCLEQNLDTLVIQPVNYSLYPLSYTGFKLSSSSWIIIQFLIVTVFIRYVYYNEYIHTKHVTVCVWYTHV